MRFKEYKKIVEAQITPWIDDTFIHNVIINVGKEKYTLLPEGYCTPEIKAISLEECFNAFGDRDVISLKAEMFGVDDCGLEISLAKKDLESWVRFEPMVYTGITKEFKVVSKSDGFILGVIKWHTGYRKYAFFVTSTMYLERIPHTGEDRYRPDTKIFDNACMREITLFMEQLMVDYKLNKETRDNETNHD